MESLVPFAFSVNLFKNLPVDTYGHSLEELANRENWYHEREVNVDVQSTPFCISLDHNNVSFQQEPMEHNETNVHHQHWNILDEL